LFQNFIKINSQLFEQRKTNRGKLAISSVFGGGLITRTTAMMLD